MSKDKRLLALLGVGYFPDELPPPFTTKSFARFRRSIGTAWAAVPTQYPKSIPEIYSIPRIRGTRRDLSIVNPIAEYHVAKLISDNWIILKTHIYKHSLSSQRIDIELDATRAVPLPDFEAIATQHSETSSSYDHILVSDISRFYSTLYTHAIPWALHTKAWSKQHLRSALYNASLGAQLDTAVRKGNDNQTIGIPVGPDSSRILSEIIAAAVDTTLHSTAAVSASCAVRNVDDWFIGFDTIGNAEDAVSALAAACRDYQLELHPDKTSVSRATDVVDTLWPSTLRQQQFSAGTVAQKRDLEHFFALAFKFSGEHPHQNVLDYAIKRTLSVRVFPDNWRRYETYLLKAARTNTTTLPVVVRVLANYRQMQYPLGETRIKKLISDLIRRSSPNGQHAEVAWSLFLAKALRLTISEADIAPVTKLESSVCALLALDLRSRNLVDGALDTALWEQSLNAAGLTGSNWLLSYEAAMKGWLATTTPNHIDGHPYFSKLKQLKVSFYDEKRNVRRIRARRRRPLPILQENVVELSQFVAATTDVSMGT